VKVEWTVLVEAVIERTEKLAENMEEAAELVLEVVPRSVEEAGTAEVVPRRVVKIAGLAL
jgi:hypothetical protein